MAFWNRGNGELEKDDRYVGYEDVEFAIADSDEYGVTRNSNGSSYLLTDREILEYENELLVDPELSKYVLFAKDEDLLIQLGSLYNQGYRDPVGADFAILDVFHRNIELYEALSKHPKTAELIEMNDFNVDYSYELGIKMKRTAYVNDEVILKYLKEYLKYQNVKPYFEDFTQGMLQVGLDGGVDDEPWNEWMFTDYIKWW